jgi:transketolase
MEIRKAGTRKLVRAVCGTNSRGASVTQANFLTSTELDDRSRYLRRLIVRGLIGGNRGHVGSSMSLVEILRVLFDEILRVRPAEPDWIGRDRCILSKGHGCLALYAILADKGFFDVSHLDKFCHVDGILGGHPERGKVPGVEASTGALGHGFSIGVGMALAARMQQRDSRVFVVMGDGEINEGSVWEAAMSACKHKLNNLTVMIDYNKIQSAGFTRDIQDLEPLLDKWRSFGFAVAEIDGHDVGGLSRLCRKLPFANDKPAAIICHTVKGRGIPFAENNPKWHHHSRFQPAELAAIDAALGDRP